ncbi:E3 ubiquitin-protein ligase SINA-like 10 [Linum perenne]
MARFSAKDDEGSSSRRRKRPRTTSPSTYSPIRPMTGSAGDDEAVILSGDENANEQLEDYAGDFLLEEVEEDDEDDADWEADAVGVMEEEVAEEEEEEDDSHDYESEEDDVDHSQGVEQLQNSQSSRSRSVSVNLTDPDVLDCAICFNTLTIPVFQCENGHTACSSCCSKMGYKCPSCCMPIGYNRCRALERVLESVTTPCPNAAHGCKEIITYSKKLSHEKDCVYAPCQCPISGCSFSNSAQQLCQHFTSNHKNRAFRFQYNTTFPAFFASDHKLLILQEEKEEILFLLTNSEELIGNMIKVSCVGPSSYKGRFFYEVSAKSGEGSSLKFQSFAENVLKIDYDVPPGGYLLLPASFFGRYKQISLDVCIYRVGTYPNDFVPTTVA